MLDSTKSALIPLFAQLGGIAAKLAELKEIERTAWEDGREESSETWESLEELEELLISLADWFSDSEPEDEDSHGL
jgi:hypothetical protein